MSAVIILAFALICAGLASAFWFVVHLTKTSNEKQKRLSKELKNPEVRSIVLQLARNQYYSSPKNTDEKRSNARRALAIIRLRKIVKDPKIRKQIYRLTDMSK